MGRKKRAFERLWGALEPGRKLNSKRPLFARQFEQLIDRDLELQVDPVSAWSLGKHVEHNYLVAHYTADRIFEAMRGQHADQRMNLMASGYFMFGWAPRGVFPTIAELVAKSGAKEDILPLRDSLEKRLETFDWTWEEIAASRGRSHHPRMTWLTARHWVYFLERHNAHHSRIARDILSFSEHAPGPARRLGLGLTQWRNKIMKPVLGVRYGTPPIEEGAATRATWMPAAQE